jgi:excisionase family DNA binding protein
MITTNTETKQAKPTERPKRPRQKLVVPPWKRLLVDPQVAAEMLSTGRTTIYKLMDDGVLAYRIVERGRRIPVSELRKYAASQLIGGRQAVVNDSELLSQ